MNDRRVWFFVAAAAACALLVPATPDEFRWVPEMLAVVYIVLAGLVALETLGRRRAGGADPPEGPPRGEDDGR